MDEESSSMVPGKLSIDVRAVIGEPLCPSIEEEHGVSYSPMILEGIAEQYAAKIRSLKPLPDRDCDLQRLDLEQEMLSELGLTGYYRFCGEGDFFTIDSVKKYCEAGLKSLIASGLPLQDIEVLMPDFYAALVIACRMDRIRNSSGIQPKDIIDLYRPNDSDDGDLLH